MRLARCGDVLILWYDLLKFVPGAVSHIWRRWVMPEDCGYEENRQPPRSEVIQDLVQRVEDHFARVAIEQSLGKLPRNPGCEAQWFEHYSHRGAAHRGGHR